MAACLDGWLPELDYFPCCKVVCLWCIMCFCCWGVFPVLTLYSPRSIVWGLFFFPRYIPHVMLYFSSIPCLPVLSTPLSYMYVVYRQVDGLFRWYLWLVTIKGYYYLIYIVKCMKFLCLKSCLFEKAKLIKHMLNSLSGAGRLVFKKINTTWI